jgi:hypothetical protein
MGVLYLGTIGINFSRVFIPPLCFSEEDRQYGQLNVTLDARAPCHDGRGALVACWRAFILVQGAAASRIQAVNLGGNSSATP